MGRLQSSALVYKPYWKANTYVPEEVKRDGFSITLPKKFSNDKCDATICQTILEQTIEAIDTATTKREV